jgi:AcrR family transcriptional regulator
MHTLVDPAADPAVDDGHRRGRILWALATCMATKGYQATTISDIARAARVSKTVVYAHFRDKEHCLLELYSYAHFRDKEHCLLELYSRANDKVLATVREALEDAHRAGLPWRERLRAGIGAHLEALADGPAVAWAALVEVQAAGRRALALRRGMVDRYVDLLSEVARGLVEEHPDEVRPVSRDLLVAAVGGINELMLARVERDEAELLRQDAELAAGIVIGLLERRD